MISFQEALATVLQAVPPLPVVELPLLAAVGLAAARELRSPQPAPPFANSAMDGYALRAGDLAAGRRRFAVVAEVAAGSVYDGPLAAGQAVRILTGAALPAAADTVVPQEDVSLVVDAADPDCPAVVSRTAGASGLGEPEIEIKELPDPGDHIRQAGEDFPAGTVLLSPGQAIDPATAGLLAAAGWARVAVRRRPRVAILSTGDELLDIGEELSPGKIRDANSYGLAAAVLMAGAVPYPAGRVADRVEPLMAALAGLPADIDVIVTSGGVSVGDYDLVAPSLARLGFQPQFHQVNIKPGKPLLFGMLGNRPVFGLSGNPTAALVLFEMLVRPALRRMMGYTDLFRPRIRAAVTRELRKRDGRQHLLRARIYQLDGAWVAEALIGQSSANLLSLTQANALLVHPAEQQVVTAGEELEAYLIRQPEDN